MFLCELERQGKKVESRKELGFIRLTLRSLALPELETDVHYLLNVHFMPGTGLDALTYFARQESLARFDT